jgi:hypothetical protein
MTFCRVEKVAFPVKGFFFNEGAASCISTCQPLAAS